MYSLAWAQIWPPYSDTSICWPMPVRPRWWRAARMPATMLRLPMWSAMTAPTIVTGPSSLPVVEISPPTA